jgi:hypothetical protein
MSVLSHCALDAQPLALLLHLYLREKVGRGQARRVSERWRSERKGRQRSATQREGRHGCVVTQAGVVLRAPHARAPEQTQPRAARARAARTCTRELQSQCCDAVPMMGAVCWS